MIQKSVD